MSDMINTQIIDEILDMEPAELGEYVKSDSILMASLELTAVSNGVVGEWSENAMAKYIAGEWDKIPEQARVDIFQAAFRKRLAQT